MSNKTIQKLENKFAKVAKSIDDIEIELTDLYDIVNATPKQERKIDSLEHKKEKLETKQYEIQCKIEGGVA